MASNDDRAATPKKWAPETQLVHGGTLRSQFGETSEAMFLTQGFVYASAEQAEARFKNEDPGFQYTPLRQSDRRHVRGARAAARGRRGGARHGERHGRRQRGVLSYLKAGDHIVSARALFGACRYVVEDAVRRATASPRR